MKFQKIGKLVNNQLGFGRPNEFPISFNESFKSLCVIIDVVIYIFEFEK